MIKAFLKFAIPVSVTGVGGASAFGALSNSQPQSVSSDSAIVLSTQEQVGKELPNTQSEVSTDSNISKETNPSSQQLQAEEPSASVSVQESPQVVQEQPFEEQIGNCRVINGPQNIISKLPTNYQYVSFTCQNPSDNAEAILTNWRGFFPSFLLQGGLPDFPEVKKFSIEVKEENVSEDEEDLENAQYETTFTSSSFSTLSPIIGRWSDEVVDDTDDDTVYKVRLLGEPSSVKYVYLTYST